MGKKIAASAPDGGWGWMCVFGSSLAHLLASILIRSYGIFYLEFLDHYQVSASAISWVGAVNMLAWGLTGPLASAMCRRFSCKVTTFIGALLLGGGIIATSYAANYPALFVSYTLAGVGMSLSYTPGYIIVGYYFDKKKATAMGLASVGAGVGAFAYPPFLLFLFRHYGYQGALLITGGMLFHAFISGSLYRPVEVIKECKEIPLDIEDRDVEMKDMSGETNRKITEKDGNIRHFDGTVESNENTEEKVAMVPKTSETQVKSGDGCCANCLSVINVQFQMLKTPIFLAIFFVNLGGIFGMQTMAAFAVAEAIEHGVPELKAGFLLSIMGITDTIARLFSGMFLDWRIIKPHRAHVFNGCVVMVGVCAICLPVVQSYAWYAFWLSMRGFVGGTFLAHRATILSDLLGTDKAADAFGFILMANAFGSLLGRLSGGIVKDNFGGYQYAFYFSGVVTILFCVVFLVVLVTKKRSKQESAQDELNVSQS